MAQDEENRDAKQPNSEVCQYYRTRLEHTLLHTQQSTRLIYLINGAMLALLYFLVGKFEKQETFAFVILVVLAFVNALHAVLIVIQGTWYSSIDNGYAKFLKTREMVNLPAERESLSLLLKSLKSPHGLYATIRGLLAILLKTTHGLYATIHGFLAIVLLIASFWVLCEPAAFRTLTTARPNSSIGPTNSPLSTDSRPPDNP